MKHDKQQDGQGNKQDSTGQNSSEVISSNTKLHEHPHLCQNLHQTGITECFHFFFLIDIQFISWILIQCAENNSVDIGCGTSESGGVLALAASSSKFCIAVPAPEQTWLVSSPDHFFDWSELTIQYYSSERSPCRSFPLDYRLYQERRNREGRLWYSGTLAWDSGPLCTNAPQGSVASSLVGLTSAGRTTCRKETPASSSSAATLNCRSKCACPVCGSHCYPATPWSYM